MYLGTIRWFDDQAGSGVVACRDLRVGDVSFADTDICNVDFRRVSAGQEVTFYLRLTPSGLRATDVLILGAPS
jgi:cold shock CspA family protein